jgi:hypothetical protein
MDIDTLVLTEVHEEQWVHRGGTHSVGLESAITVFYRAVSWKLTFLVFIKHLRIPVFLASSAWCSQDSMGVP